MVVTVVLAACAHQAPTLRAGSSVDAALAAGEVRTHDVELAAGTVLLR